MPGVDADSMARTRTALAAERTLMAWVRTALSMISFGFTIAKFFIYLHQSNPNVADMHGPRNLGLTLVAVGVFGVAAGIAEYFNTLSELGLHAIRPKWSVTVIIAVVVAIIGVIVFVSGLTRSGPF